MERPRTHSGIRVVARRMTKDSFGRVELGPPIGAVALAQNFLSALFGVGLFLGQLVLALALGLLAGDGEEIGSPDAWRLETPSA